MIFKSFDNKRKVSCETEVRSVDINTIHVFIQTWVSDYIARFLKSPDFKYSLFPWDEIIKYSFVVGSPYRCYQAVTDDHLDGLLCLSMDKVLKIEYIATAPWNYYTVGKMRRIGTGLLYFTIRRGIYVGGKGDFYLNALPDAELFYEKMGMIKTGEQNVNGLNEYYMPEKEAAAFEKSFKKYLIKE